MSKDRNYGKTSAGSSDSARDGDPKYDKDAKAGKYADGGVMGIVKRDLGRLADKVNPFSKKSTPATKDADAVKTDDAPKIKTELGGLNLTATQRREKEAGL